MDSVNLAEKINKEAETLGRTFPIYLEVNATREPQKSGFSPEELGTAVKSISQLKSATVIGLMCMGKKDDPLETRKAFQLCRALADEHGLNECSMGMSDDYKIALEEGTTMVRLGRAIFR